MTTAKQILYVEDDAAIVMPLKYALEREGWQVTWVSQGRLALAETQSRTFDFIILDVGLPDIDGFEVCKQLRQYCHTPLLFLTARDDEIDRIVGLEIGADDYCHKPFSAREIISRIKSVWRRMQLSQNSVSANSPANTADDTVQASQQSVWQCQPERLQILYFCEALQLTRYEYGLLKFLIDHPSQVFSRQQLMDQVWEHPDHSLDRTVDTHIKSLRAKLKKVRSELEPIQTHRGFGYSLELQ